MSNLRRRIERIESKARNHIEAAVAFRIVLDCMNGTDTPENLEHWRKAFADWQSHLYGRDPRQWSRDADIWRPPTDRSESGSACPDPGFLTTLPHLSDAALEEAIRYFNAWIARHEATGAA